MKLIHNKKLEVALAMLASQCVSPTVAKLNMTKQKVDVGFQPYPITIGALGRRRLSYNVGINNAAYITGYEGKTKRLTCPTVARWESILKAAYATQQT